jgi:rubrerythrin
VYNSYHESFIYGIEFVKFKCEEEMERGMGRFSKAEEKENDISKRGKEVLGEEKVGSRDFFLVCCVCGFFFLFYKQN